MNIEGDEPEAELDVHERDSELITATPSVTSEASELTSTPSVGSTAGRVPPHLRHLLNANAGPTTLLTGQTVSPSQSATASSSFVATASANGPVVFTSATSKAYQSYNAYDTTGNRFTREKQLTMDSDGLSTKSSYSQASTVTTRKSRGGWAKPVSAIL